MVWFHGEQGAWWRGVRGSRAPASVFPWAAVVLTLEAPVEIGQVAKAALEGDAGDRLHGFSEQPACMAEADFVDQRCAGLAGYAFGLFTKICG